MTPSQVNDSNDVTIQACGGMQRKGGEGERTHRGRCCEEGREVGNGWTQGSQCLSERSHPKESFWWKMLMRGESGEPHGKGCRVPDSKEGRWFRLRFRVPYSHFCSIVNGLRSLDDEQKWWSESPDDTDRKSTRLNSSHP